MATAKLVKPTTKNSPAIVKAKGKFNGTAQEYAPPHTMKDKPVKGDAGVHYPEDPNTLNAEESRNGGMPARRVSLGDPTLGAKTDGIKMRGAGAAERGFMSRGPMA
jgi:hypothetical protein